MNARANINPRPCGFTDIRKVGTIYVCRNCGQKFGSDFLHLTRASLGVQQFAKLEAARLLSERTEHESQ